MRLSSGFKTLIAATIVTATILVGAAGVGFSQYAALARRVDGEKLDAAGRAAQAEILSRMDRSRQLTGDIASDPSVVSYIAQAMSTPGAGGQGVDTASIRDLIGNRARKAGFDFAAVLDDNGRLLTASGDDIGGNAAVSRLGVASAAMKRLAPASAVGYLQNRVYLLAAAPLVSGQQAQALLLTGIRFGNDDLNILSARVGSQLALQMPRNLSQRIVAASLPAESLTQLRRLAEDPAAVWLAPPQARTFDVRLDTQPERLHVLPLQSDDVPVSIMAIAPIVADAALTRAIAVPILACAAAAIASAWLILGLFWWRAAQPLARLAGLSERALHGDHALDFRVRGTPAIVRIGACLNDFSLRLDRHRVLPGTPRRRTTDVDTITPLRAQRALSDR